MDKISNTVSYEVATIDHLINGLCSRSRRNQINICSNTILESGKKNISLGFFNTSHFNGGDKYAQKF